MTGTWIAAALSSETSWVFIGDELLHLCCKAAVLQPVYMKVVVHPENLFTNAAALSTLYTLSDDIHSADCTLVTAGGHNNTTGL